MSSASRLALGILLIRDYQLLPVMTLAVAVRLYGITHSAIWFDEAYSVLISAMPPADIWRYSANDVHPPLYYFLLHVWMILFGEGVFSVRLMSAVTGVLTVPVSVWLVGVIATRRAAILAGVLSALLPFAVRYSQEARMYALVALFCLASTLALVYWVKNSRHDRYLYVYALIMALGFYTHYFAGLCLAVHWLYLLTVCERGRSLAIRPGWWMANLAVVVLYLPWVPALLMQLTHLHSVGWIPQMSVRSVVSQIWLFLTLEPASDRPLVAYFCAPVIVVLMTVALLKREPGHYRFNALLTLYTFAPILLVALVSFKVALFWPRYFLFAAMGLPLLLALGLDQLIARRRRLGIVCLIVLMGVQVSGLRNVYAGQYKINNPYQRQESGIDRVSAYVNAHGATGDRVLVYGLNFYPSALYYNKTDTKPLLFMPVNVFGERPDSVRAGSLWDQDGKAFYIDSLGRVPVDTRRVWFIYEDSQTRPDFPDHWRLVDCMTVGDTTLSLYTLEPPSLR
ncbi:glycosyltransferase family 39 protein [Pseudomonas viridiflava]|uniref:glycosyltransferase family 39 protein n=1 Tax=Pseudomonas viridiflava TaxID=33069 RepID=UPI0013C2E706|nr:glycosyltransferase family 39 protein [Pseudomonas viridiflava]